MHSLFAVNFISLELNYLVFSLFVQAYHIFPQVFSIPQYVQWIISLNVLAIKLGSTEIKLSTVVILDLCLAY